MLLRKAVPSITTAVVYLWIGGTALLVLVGSFFTVAEHSNLGLGLLEVQGAAALFIGVSLGVTGLGAIVLLWRRSSVGSILLFSYCVFFGVSLGAAVVKDMLGSGKVSAILQEDLPLLLMLAAFLGCALWARKLASARRAELQ